MDTNKISFGVLTMSLGGIVNGLLDELKAKVANLDERLLFLENEKARLESGDIFYAVEYWRSDKYMYLNFLSIKGEKRRRQYVGANPVNIEKARQGILRAKEYDALLQRINDLTGIYDNISSLIKEASHQIDKEL